MTTRRSCQNPAAFEISGLYCPVMKLGAAPMMGAPSTICLTGLPKAIVSIDVGSMNQQVLPTAQPAVMIWSRILSYPSPFAGGLVSAVIWTAAALRFVRRRVSIALDQRCSFRGPLRGHGRLLGDAVAG